MNHKAPLLTFIFGICSFVKLFGQADPGCLTFTFDQSILKINETANLSAVIGNFSSLVKTGTNLTPNDASFTIVIPAELRVKGTVIAPQVPFQTVVSGPTLRPDGTTTIVITVPSGIPKGASMTVVIPVVGFKESISNVTYATMKVASDLSGTPSGNILPENDTRSSAVVVANALPVTLVSFNVSKTGEDPEGAAAVLRWTTTEEVGSDRFDIEHSRDGKQWTLVGSVSSHGDSRARNDYDFTHSNPVSGTNYYRLKMVDKNLTFAYSSIRHLDFSNSKLLIYPNPVAETLIISSDEIDKISQVQLLNLSGTIVYDSGSKGAKTVDVRKMITGTYILKITRTDDSVSNQKVLIVR